MKKIFIIFILLFCIGCQQNFLDIPTETHTYYTLYYTPKELFEKRTIHYSSARKLLKTFGGLKNLKYEGKVFSAIPEDYYILVFCKKYGSSNKIYINYENSILNVVGLDSSLEGKYLFTCEIEDFTNYILLDGKNDFGKTHIHYEFERLDYFERIDFIKDLKPEEFLILFEGLELEEKLELLEMIDDLKEIEKLGN